MSNMKILKNKIRHKLENFFTSIAYFRNSSIIDIPPEWIKRSILLKTIKYKNIKNFIETGTFLGETSILVAENVEEVYTCELSKPIYEKFLMKLNQVKKESLEKINHYNNDSLEFLKIINEKSILSKSNTLFWLDSHYSGGLTEGKRKCPLLKEINYILKNISSDSIILVDDIHNMNGLLGYPTISQIKKLINSLDLGFNFQIYSNILFIYKRELNNNDIFV